MIIYHSAKSNSLFLFNLVEYFNAVPFDLIIIAVKGTALEEAIKEI